MRPSLSTLRAVETRMLTFRKSGLIIENVCGSAVHAGPATAAKFVAQSTIAGA
jgi:hypothetical protein